MRALVVEGDALAQRSLRRHLTDLGFEIEWSTQVEEARRLCRRRMPEMIVVDWMLPSGGSDGLCRWVRRTPGGDLPTIVCITSRLSPGHILEAVGAGCDDFLTRPLTGDVLRTRLWIARRTVEQRLLRRKLEEEKTRFFHGSLDLLAIADEDGFLTEVNPAWKEFFGGPEAGDGSWHVLDVVDATDRGEASSVLASVGVAGGTGGFTARHHRADGEERWIHWQVTSRTTDTRLYVNARDVTERRRIEQEARRSEDRLRQIVQHIEGVFWMGDPDLSRFHFVSPHAREILGLDPAELQQNPALWFSVVDVRDRERVRRELGRAADGSQEVEYAVVHPQGERRWVSCRVFPILGQGGRISRLAGIVEDITERRVRDSQSIQSQKLEAIGQLAAGIAHEINSPTQYVGDNLGFLRDCFQPLCRLVGAVLEEDPSRLPEPLATCRRRVEEEEDLEVILQEIPDAVEQSLDGVKRISRIVRAMREFSHPGSDAMEPVDINHALENTLQVARNEYKYVADLDLDLAEDLPPVPCLPSELNQVFLNLLVNAAQAIEDVGEQPPAPRGRIGVSTRRVEETVEVRISDTGVGISAEDSAHVFEPFFTTKEVGRGTGQGLAIAHSVVIGKHGGSLDFESAPGRGTTFILRLPLRQVAVEEVLVP